MAEDYSTCHTCRRAILASDADEFGNCVLCRAASAVSSNTEAEWADLGRPEESTDDEDTVR